MASLAMVLVWFPIFVGVAFGARLVGRRRAVMLGVLCALLWVAVGQANWGAPGAGGPETLGQQIGWAGALLCGAAAILLMSCCGPERSAGPRRKYAEGEAGDAEGRSTGNIVAAEPEVRASSEHGDDGAWGLAAGDFVLQSMISVYQQFDAWLEIHRYNDDPWPDFDEFLRGLLFQWVGGTHVRTYRVLSDGDELIPLREINASTAWRDQLVSARRGIEGYVATTGRSFVAGDPTHGKLVDQLMPPSIANDGTDPHACPGDRSEREVNGPAWCFAVVRGSHKVGVVTVHRFELSPRGGQPADVLTRRASAWSPTQLRLVELVIAEFWNAVTEVYRCRAAVTTDPDSGGLTRKAFFEIGRELLADAYRKGEPVAVAVMGMEGVRALDDDGQWEVADDIRASMSAVLKRRLRSEDRLGRFDDSRFVLLLRRVDSELATLIVKELMGQLTNVLEARGAYGRRVTLRCGLAGSGITPPTPTSVKPSLEGLVTAALDLCQQARLASVAMLSDLHPAQTPETEVAAGR